MPLWVIRDRQGNGDPFGRHYGASRTARSSAIVIRDRGSLSRECASESSRALGEGRGPPGGPLAVPASRKKGFTLAVPRAGPRAGPLAGPLAESFRNASGSAHGTAS